MCGGHVTVCEHVPLGHGQFQDRHAGGSVSKGHTHEQRQPPGAPGHRPPNAVCGTSGTGHPRRQCRSWGTPVDALCSGKPFWCCSKCGPALGPDGTAGRGRASTDGPGKKALPLPWLPVVGSEHEHTWSVVNRVRLGGHEQTSPAEEVESPLACPDLVPPPNRSRLWGFDV